MKVYIAGPMSGYQHLNFPAFFAAEEKLKELGYEPLNPARLVGEKAGYVWNQYMREDMIYLIRDADAIAMLPNWERSKGARIENFLAVNLDMPVLYLDDNCNVVYIQGSAS